MNENFSLPETCTVVQSAEKEFDKGLNKPNFLNSGTLKTVKLF